MSIIDGPRRPYRPSRAGRYGWVVLNVRDAADGSAASVTVRATSGRAVLDEGGDAMAFQARDEGRNAIAPRTELAVRFRLDETG